MSSHSTKTNLHEPKLLCKDYRRVFRDDVQKTPADLRTCLDLGLDVLVGQLLVDFPDLQPSDGLEEPSAVGGSCASRLAFQQTATSLVDVLALR